VAQVFEHQLRDPIERVNTLLIASQAPVTREKLERAAETLPADLRPLASAAASRVTPPLGGGQVYTDDLAPVEWLIDKSIVEYAAQGAPPE
jgi:hypothetical protein